MPTINNLLLNVFIILLFALGTYALNYLLKGKYKEWNAGLLSSLAVILCMSFPFKLMTGQIYDLRIVILLTVILYGGYGAGVFVMIIAFIYRYLIGGFGFIQMAITFLPILSITFYFLPHFKRCAPIKKILITAGFCIAIVTLNIAFVIAMYPITQMHMLFLLEWGLIETLCTALMVFMIETINKYIAMSRQLLELEKRQLVSALTASIAHEIRNPLTVCRGFTQLLNETLKDEKQMTYSGIILTELDHTSTIIDNYLSFSKPEMNQMEQTDTAQIVAHTIAAISPYGTLKNVEIIQKPMKNLSIYIDQSKFEQAILNIIKNGIEAMPNGGTLRVEVCEQNRMAVIDIIDTGIGMAKEQLNNLGNPFYSTKTSGSGLGLMTSYRFIHLMKGKIEVESTLGHGTTFSVHIPLHTPTTTASNNHARTKRKREAAT